MSGGGAPVQARPSPDFFRAAASPSPAARASVATPRLCFPSAAARRLRRSIAALNLIGEREVERPGYQGHRQRLRERFLKGGLAAFADHEVLELLLTLAIPRADVKPQAKALLRRFGSLQAVLDAPVPELRSVPGIGEVAAIGLRIIRETAASYLQRAAQGQPLLETGKLIDFWRMRIGALRHEVFAVGYLDTGYRLLPDGVEIVQEGTLDRAAVYPREVVAGALRREAAALTLAHNHPNGNVQPSPSDRALTNAIVAVAEAVDVRVFDHVVVSPDASFSFRAVGWL